MDLLLYVFLTMFGFSQSKVVNPTCSQIKAFVDGHNLRRLRVAKGSVPNQPAAAEMKFMVWDDELAAKATKWASNNKFFHNPNKKIDSNRFTTGENIYWSYSTDSSYKLKIDTALDSWFNEYENYSFGALKSSDFNKSSDKMIGHYTQMVWSNSTYIGCGMSKQMMFGEVNYYVVCNYGPAGNYLGETPYKHSNEGSEELTCAIDDCSRPYGVCH